MFLTVVSFIEEENQVGQDFWKIQTEMLLTTH